MFEEIAGKNKILASRADSASNSSLNNGCISGRSFTVLVHIILTEPGDQYMIERYICLLSYYERQRADAFKRLSDRLCYVATHLLARAVLYNSGMIGRNDWPVVQDASGKPRLMAATGRKSGFFSLAHSRAAGACVCASGPIGVDIEAIPRDLEIDHLAPMVLSPSERRWIMAQGPRDRVQAFLRLWTAKEALSKAEGTGLAIGFDRLTLDVSRNDHFTLVDGPPSLGDLGSWLVRAFSVGCSYVGCVALKRTGRVDPGVELLVYDCQTLAPLLDAYGHLLSLGGSGQEVEVRWRGACFCP